MSFSKSSLKTFAEESDSSSTIIDGCELKSQFNCQFLCFQIYDSEIIVAYRQGTEVEAGRLKKI